MATTKLGSFLVRYSITTRVTSSEFSTTTAWSFERWCRLSNCVAVALLDRDLGPPWPAAEQTLWKIQRDHMPVKSDRAETAIRLRDHALTIVRQYGRYQQAGDAKFLTWKGAGFSMLLRTPLSEMGNGTGRVRQVARRDPWSDTGPCEVSGDPAWPEASGSAALWSGHLAGEEGLQFRMGGRWPDLHRQLQTRTLGSGIPGAGILKKRAPSVAPDNPHCGNCLRPRQYALSG
jgi:hypothetical protein